MNLKNSYNFNCGFLLKEMILKAAIYIINDTLLIFMCESKAQPGGAYYSILGGNVNALLMLLPRGNCIFHSSSADRSKVPTADENLSLIHI